MHFVEGLGGALDHRPDMHDITLRKDYLSRYKLTSANLQQGNVAGASDADKVRLRVEAVNH
jgi:hypothetical protein